MSAKKVKPPKGVSNPDGNTASKGDTLAGLVQFGFEGEPDAHGHGGRYALVQCQ